MSEWQDIETANIHGDTGIIELARIEGGKIYDQALGYWYEGDMDAGWATPVRDRVCEIGKPIGFDPTHWRPLSR